MSGSEVAKGFSSSMSYPAAMSGIAVETCSISIVPLMTASASCGRSASSSADPKHISSGMPKVSAAFLRRRSEGSATPTIRSSSGLWRAYRL